MSPNVVCKKVELDRIARILLDVANSYTCITILAGLHLFFFSHKAKTDFLKLQYARNEKPWLIYAIQ